MQDPRLLLAISLPSEASSWHYRSHKTPQCHASKTVAR